MKLLDKTDKEIIEIAKPIWALLLVVVVIVAFWGEFNIIYIFLLNLPRVE